MRFTALVTAGAIAFAPATQADAQVSGTIVIGGGPIGGVVHIGEPRIVRPRGRVVVVERHAPRVIVVEKWGKGRRHGHVRRMVYYDRRYDRYYDRYRPGLIEIYVYEHKGRYYRYDDDHYRDRDRWRDRDDRRHDRDRWDDRRGRDRDRDRDWDRDRDRNRDRDRGRDRGRDG